METESPNNAALAAEKRIAAMTLVLGLCAAVPVGLRLSVLAGAGVAVGTILGWLNYQWLRQTAAVLQKLSTAGSSGESPRISKWTYGKLFGRYFLIGVVLYVMVTRFAVPIASLLAGMLAPGAAAMVDGVYENLRRSR